MYTDQQLHENKWTHLSDQRCGALPWSLHADSHLSDTVLVYMAKLQINEKQETSHLRKIKDATFLGTKQLRYGFPYFYLFNIRSKPQ